MIRVRRELTWFAAMLGLAACTAGVEGPDTVEGPDPATATAEAELSRSTGSDIESFSQPAGEGVGPTELLPGPGGGDGCCGVAEAGKGGCSVCCTSGTADCVCGGDACSCRCN
jgi:hypothetical protein